MSATFDRVLLYAVGASMRLARHVDDPPALQALLRDLGFDVPNGFALPDIGAAIGSALSIVDEVRQTPNLERLSATQIVRFARSVGDVALAVGRLADVVNAQLPHSFLAASQIADRLPRRMLDWLVTAELMQSRPAFYHFARLAGLIEARARAQDAATFQTEFVEHIVRWDRIAGTLADPFRTFRERYVWGQAPFDSRAVLEAVRDVLRALNIPADVIEASAGGQPTLSVPLLSQNQDEMLLAVIAGEATPQVPSELPGLRASLAWTAPIGAEVELEPGLALAVQLGSAVAGRLDVTMRPASDLQVALAAGAGAGRIAIDLKRSGIDGPLRLLTITPALRIECGSIRWTFGAQIGTGRNAEAFAELAIQEGRLLISAAEGDGFLQSLLPAQASTVTFDVALGFSSRRGLYVSGSGGLETDIGLHVSLGFVTLETLHLGLSGSDEVLGLQASLTGNAGLGPLTVSVDRVGLRLALGLAPGNLGPIDLQIGFKPPTGLGLLIDAGPITGGGYILFDPDAGRYAGALELEMYGVAVTAIGVLDTRDSTGQPLPAPGFSFLMIISAEFQGVQLGFGFTLNGVGGLVGIHRAMALERLRSGVRDGSLDHVMFPADPVRNMPQIISDLSAFFPPTSGRFVFGPMAEIGWGTPTLFEAELGIVLEVPAEVVLALLGQINVALPTKDADIVSLHIAILGVLDTGKKLLSIDASLYNSHIALFAVYGDMAMRLSWGEPPNFALSIGGLNPHFQPPPEFPTLRRVTVALGLGDNPRIALQGYLAVTSNSIQFGAAAEIYAAAWELNVYGWLKFDALVVFSPFYFCFEFSVGFALRWGEGALAGIAVSGLLSGPTPFHIRGDATVSILFIDITIGFDVTIGDSRPVELPRKDPWPLLEAAIADFHNWSATVDSNVRPAVRYREQSDPTLLLVHPMGAVTLRQKVLPLNSQLDKFGEFAIDGATHFDVSAVNVGTPAASFDFVDDFFAPGQFRELSNSEKLSRKSFEKMHAGVAVGSARLKQGRPESARIAAVEYKTVAIDAIGAPSRSVTGPSLRQAEQVALSARSSKAYSPLRQSGLTRFADLQRQPIVQIDDESYAIASTIDARVRNDIGTGLSKEIAYQLLEAYLAAHPEDRGYLHIVPLSEVPAAA